MLLGILEQLSLIKNTVFVDIDIGACHTRIARYLQSQDRTDLEGALKDPQFWAAQINLVKPVFKDKSVDVNDKTIKSILKVGLYTSLNGANKFDPNV